MARHAYRLWIVALLLGWAFDFLFWEKSLGANYPIFLGLSLLAGLALLLAHGIRPARSSLLLLVPLLFFAAASMARSEPLTRGLSAGLALLCGGLLAVTYLGGRWIQYSLGDYIANLLMLGGSLLARPVLFLRQARKEQAASGEPARAFPVGPVVRGFAIAIPILVVFSYLLASADAVYNKKVFDFFEPDQLTENLQRLGLILVVAYGAAGVFLHAATHSREARLVGEEQPLVHPFLGLIEAGIVLGSLAVLFTLFVIIQFQYFFGGQVNIGVEGFTYSQYARRGFNELATVAVLSLLLTLGFSAVTRRAPGVERRIFSALCLVNAALVVVMLVSASQRLALAIDWHGFSRLRLYPRVFIVWIGILLVAVVALEIIGRERFFALAVLLALFGFAVTLNLMNVDGAIVRHNIQRELQKKYMNIHHLSSLSTDAVPALADAFHDPRLPQTTREAAGAALLCFQHNDPNWDTLKEGWRAYHFSTALAYQTLEALQPELEGFLVNDDTSAIRVRTPGSHWFECAVE